MHNTRVRIFFNKKGQVSAGNFSFPARPILYHRLEGKKVIMDFSLAWRPLFLQLTQNWPDPLEWLKISLSGQLVYYSSIGYGDLASLFDQFYVPCPFNELETQGLLNYLEKKTVQQAACILNNLETFLPDKMFDRKSRKPPVEKIIDHWHHWQRFYRHGLARLLQCRINVLPPDSMICDYDVFPIVIATGCLYNCGFCTVKDGTEFSLRTISQVKKQANTLAKILGKEMDTYKGIFIGNQDGLNAPIEHICYACEMGTKLMPSLKNCFMFGSIDSLLAKSDDFFRSLESTGLDIYINIGIESVDQSVLNALKKPVNLLKVKEAWERINYINYSFPRIEISCNILANIQFPNSHWQGLIRYLKNNPTTSKGPIYLSPFKQPINREFFQLAKRIKRQSTKPIRIYNLVPL